MKKYIIKLKGGKKLEIKVKKLNFNDVVVWIYSETEPNAKEKSFIRLIIPLEQIEYIIDNDMIKKEGALLFNE